MNVCVLVGRLTRDVELRRTGNGTAVASFTIAVNRTYADASGEKQADFIPCVVWQTQAENMARYCSKGSQVAVEGSLQSRQYQDNNGNNRNIIELVCNRVQYLSTNNNQGQAQQTQQTQQTTYVYDNNDPYGGFDIMDDDIQF